MKNRKGPRLSHVDARGRARMVDVGAKPITRREAVARGRIRISSEALRLIRRGQIAKGDPLETARLAGIMAAKRTAGLMQPLEACCASVAPFALEHYFESLPLDASLGIVF